MNINVNDLLRCILGHLLAVNVVGKESIENILKKEVDNEFFLIGDYRKYILNEIDGINDVDIYYWYYPYSEVVLIPYFMKNVNILNERIPSIHGSLIKIFPIAIYIIKRDKDVLLKNVSKLNLLQDKLILNINEILTEKLRYFPEHVGSQWGIVASYPEATVTIKKQ